MFAYVYASECGTPTTRGSVAETVAGRAKFAEITDRLTRQNKSLNAGFMIHLPSRPKRQTIDQWKKIFTVGCV
jgi:hypothetical protein